jgi:hypothetical protein
MKLHSLKWKLAAITILISLASCTKDNKIFSLKTIRLNDCRSANIHIQKVYFKVFTDNNMATPLTTTDVYPGYLTLPATFKVAPTLQMTLYSKTYYVQLWGDSTGYIGACKIIMADYKIMFPIDMEVKNDSLNISIMGSWK